MTDREQKHIDRAYGSVRDALDELAQVLNKDKTLRQMQGALYRMEDVLWQYASEDKKRRA